MVISLVILLIGKYKLLDNLMKYIILILTLSTIIAVSVALLSTEHSFDFTQIIPSEAIEITFLIAFLGWMPAPLDVSHLAFYLGGRKKTKLLLKK